MRNNTFKEINSIVNSHKGTDVKLTLRKGNIDIYGTFLGIIVDTLGKPARFRVKIRRNESNIDVEFRSRDLSRFKLL